MSRDAFIAKHLDELIGLLVGAFAQQTKTTHKINEQAWADDGKFMMAQMKRARDLLGRMWDDLNPAKEKPK